MTKIYKEIGYPFGASAVIVNEHNEVLASCRADDGEARRAMIQKHRPMNAGVGCLELVG